MRPREALGLPTKPVAVFSVLAILLLLACEAEPSAVSTGRTAEPAGTRISWTGLATPAVEAPDPDLERGEQVYLENCAACHGEGGEGGGVCAPFMSPQPRDFTSGLFRFKTTAEEQMPTDQDLFRTVSAGLHGTGMPPWQFLLSEEDRWAVVHYIKKFSEYFEDPIDDIVELGSPPELTDEAIERGRALYLEANCDKCHGALGYGDGPSAAEIEDDFGNPLLPRNFHKIGQFKRGYTLSDVALTIHTGNNGTPMPSFHFAYEPEQIWDLAAYVMSFAEHKMSSTGTPAAAVQGESLGEPDVVVELLERNWKFVPNEIRVQEGQVVRINFQPTDNGVGAGHGFAIDGYDRAAFINGAMVQRPKSVTFVADKAGTFVFYCASQCSTGPLHPNMNGTLIVEPAG